MENMINIECTVNENCKISLPELVKGHKTEILLPETILGQIVGTFKDNKENDRERKV